MLLLLLFSLKINDASNIKHIQNRDAMQQFQMQTFSQIFCNTDSKYNIKKMEWR